MAPPLEREVLDYDEYTGHIAAVEEVAVRSRVRGYLVKVNFTEGAEIKQGDVLFEIDPRPFQADLDAAKGKVAQWEAKLTRAEADVTRYERLLPKGAASQKDLDTAIADRGESRAAIQSARAEVDRAALDVEFAKVTAPISGRVSRANVTKGNLVNASGAETNPLTTIVSMNPIYVYFDVDERALVQYQQALRKPAGGGQQTANVRDAKIPVSLGLAGEAGFPHEGVIDFANNQVDSQTGTIQVRGVFANANRALTPGLFARVRVPVGDKYQAMLVPERAIGTDQGQKYLLAVNDKNVVEYRAVKLGRLFDNLRVIQEGVKPGELVIVNGIQRARPGLTVTPQRAEVTALGAAAAVAPPAGAAKQPTAAPETASAH
ncbi:MAG: efflux RND transporter periplasmic adaptor subunit [Deltaproteobacteria bacterium]|nr:efflux RND transporter periplasmic adaptor subunit [Deltaproteobacteria bacterium]